MVASRTTVAALLRQGCYCFVSCPVGVPPTATGVRHFRQEWGCWGRGRWCVDAALLPSAPTEILNPLQDTLPVRQNANVHVVEIIQAYLQENRARNLVLLKNPGVLSEPKTFEPLHRVSHAPAADFLAVECGGCRAGGCGWNTTLFCLGLRLLLSVLRVLMLLALLLFISECGRRSSPGPGLRLRLCPAEACPAAAAASCEDAIRRALLQLLLVASLDVICVRPNSSSVGSCAAPSRASYSWPRGLPHLRLRCKIRLESSESLFHLGGFSSHGFGRPRSEPRLPRQWRRGAK